MKIDGMLAIGNVMTHKECPMDVHMNVYVT